MLWCLATTNYGITGYKSYFYDIIWSHDICSYLILIIKGYFWCENHKSCPAAAADTAVLAAAAVADVASTAAAAALATDFMLYLTLTKTFTFIDNFTYGVEVAIVYCRQRAKHLWNHREIFYIHTIGRIASYALIF